MVKCTFLRTVIMVCSIALCSINIAHSGAEQEAKIWDRLEILNVVQSFSHFLDERSFDKWKSLFTDDILFEAFPGDGTRIEIRGKSGLVSFFENRYSKGELASGQRRHALSTIRVAEQSQSTARVLLYVTITMAHNKTELSIVTTGTYDIRLVKTNAGWKANAWKIRSDIKASPPIEVPDDMQNNMSVTPLSDQSDTQ